MDQRIKTLCELMPNESQDRLMCTLYKRSCSSLITRSWITTVTPRVKGQTSIAENNYFYSPIYLLLTIYNPLELALIKYRHRVTFT